MSENWDFYPCLIEDEPASIMVNLGLAEIAPLEDLPDCAWLHVKMQAPRSDGLSSTEEFDRLCEIGDALESAASEASADLRYVGRCTSGGRRDFYTYAASGVAAESVLSLVMTAFPEYRFETGHRDDVDWRLYRGFLYPTDRSLQVINNRRVVEALERTGDSLEQPRTIRHFAAFDDVDSCEAFCAGISDQGFTIVDRDLNEQTQKYAVTFERTDSVDFMEINRLTLELLEFANSHGGDYDGWETQAKPMVNGDDRAADHKADDETTSNDTEH